VSDIVDHPAAGYPAWLKRSLVPVTVLVGPSGNGAAAEAMRRQTPGVIIIDKSAIIREISGGHPGDWINQALARRNELLAQLASPRAIEAAGITAAIAIEQAPKRWQRQFWADRLGAEVVLLDPGRAEALIGAEAEGVPARYVHQWYAEAAEPADRPVVPSERPSAARRGYNGKHRLMRDKQLAKEPWCRFCWDERQVKVPATVLDHIEPFRDAAGEMDFKLWGDPKNHRSLCQPCHDARGATRSRPEKAPGAGIDGRPLDPAHPWNRRKTL
jgi:5-methylcytosine-specific restriction enzyme A